jgi:hypothetical protein
MKGRLETARRNLMSRRKPPNAPAFHFRSRSPDMAAMREAGTNKRDLRIRHRMLAELAVQAPGTVK